MPGSLSLLLTCLAIHSIIRSSIMWDMGLLIFIHSRSNASEIDCLILTLWWFFCRLRSFSYMAPFKYCFYKFYLYLSLLILELRAITSLLTWVSFLVKFSEISKGVHPWRRFSRRLYSYSEWRPFRYSIRFSTIGESLELLHNCYNGYNYNQHFNNFQ